ncbi:MAG: cytochrome c [Deltaproteobacteria bacterium]|nr:MAG: cytochrome c [Deltaproteobacteria bacterium]
MKRPTQTILLLLSLAALSPVLLTPARALADDGTKELWSKHCAKCHGKDGRGKTLLGKKLKIVDYTDPEWQKKVSDEELKHAILEGAGEPKKDGTTPMPSFKEKLSAEQVEKLVKWVRNFAQEREEEAEGAQ